MAHTKKTLKLGGSWDIELTESGLLAVLEGAPAAAQNAACECRLFAKDACFAQERGIPYFLLALGQKLPASALRAALRRAVLRTDGAASVTEISLERLDFETRRITGEIRFATGEGEDVAAYL